MKVRYAEELDEVKKGALLKVDRSSTFAMIAMCYALHVVLSPSSVYLSVMVFNRHLDRAVRFGSLSGVFL